MTNPELELPSIDLDLFGQLSESDKKRVLKLVFCFQAGNSEEKEVVYSDLLGRYQIWQFG